MEVLLANKHLERLCARQREQEKPLGSAGARKLRARLADLMAAATVAELAAGHPHPLRGERAGQFALNLDGGRRLVFAPANEPLPRRPDGGRTAAWPGSG